MLLAFLGRDESLHPVAEEDDANLVVVLNRGERQRGRHLRDEILLEAHARAELARARHVDQQDHSVLPLLLEDLDVGLVHARRDVPVDVAHVVAILVFADFAESHAPALEGRVVFAGEDMVGEAAGLDLDLAHPPQQLGTVHSVVVHRPHGATFKALRPC